MKLVKLSKNANGADLWEFHLGLEELRLLKGVLEPALLHTPRTIETESVRHRTRNILIGIKRALDQQIGRNKDKHEHN